MTRWLLLLLIACRHEPTLEWIEVHVALPGASAEQMAKTIEGVERYLAAIDGVVTVRSESTSGLSSILVGATADVTTPVNDVVAGAHRTWPPEMLYPTSVRRRPLVARLTVPVGRGEATARKIEMLSGVTQVDRCDAAEARIRYALDAERLAALGATPGDAYEAAMRAPDKPLAAVVAKGVTLGELVAKLPPVPACRATTRDGEVALLEVYGDDVTSLAGFGTVLPPLVEGVGDTGDVVITGAAKRVLVAHAPAATLTIASVDAKALMSAATAIVAKLGASALLVRGSAVETVKVVEIDRERAADLGVSVSAIAQTLALATDDGATIADLVLVAKGPLRVRSPRVGAVPLEDVEHMTERSELREVLRVDGRRVVTVLAPEEVDVGTLPAGVTATWSRTIER